MKETTYKLVANFVGYRVGDDGSVWTSWVKKHPKGCGRGVSYVVGEKWVKMKLCVHKNGYISVHLRKDGKQHHKLLHRLILECFVGPCPDGMECRHFPDDNKANCRLENLSWNIKSINQKDRIIHGSHCRGENHGIASTNNSVAKEIRARFLELKNKAQIAREFGLSRSVVSRIILGKTYV